MVINVDLKLLLYLNSNDCDKYVFRMQKAHKSKGGTTQGAISRKDGKYFSLSGLPST